MGRRHRLATTITADLEMGFGDAYWMDASGGVRPLNALTHVQEILRNPQSYGLTLPEIQPIKSAPNGTARDQALEKLMFGKGWVRIRMVGDYLIAHGKITRAAKKNINKFIRTYAPDVMDVFTKSWPSGKEEELPIRQFEVAASGRKAAVPDIYTQVVRLVNQILDDADKPRLQSLPQQDAILTKIKETTSAVCDNMMKAHKEALQARQMSVPWVKKAARRTAMPEETDVPTAGSGHPTIKAFFVPGASFGDAGDYIENKKTRKIYGPIRDVYAAYGLMAVMAGADSNPLANRDQPTHPDFRVKGRFTDGELLQSYESAGKTLLRGDPSELPLPDKFKDTIKYAPAFILKHFGIRT